MNKKRILLAILIICITFIFSELYFINWYKKNHNTEEQTVETTVISVNKASIIDKLNKSLHDYFNTNNNFTINFYVSSIENSYTDDDLYMTISKTDKLSYTYISNYIEVYEKDDIIYYYDTYKDAWCKDNTIENTQYLVSDVDLSSITNVEFPDDAIVETRLLNNIEYHTVVIDTDHNSEILYYFDTNYNFVAASSNLVDSNIVLNTNTGNYLYMVFSTDNIELPEECNDCDDGNYNWYITQFINNLDYNTSDDTTDEDNTVETIDIIDDKTTNESIEEDE